MKRAYHYKWIGTNGKESWQSKGVHLYLLKGGINLAYMRMKEWSGERKLMTAKERIDMQIKGGS